MSSSRDHIAARNQASITLADSGPDASCIKLYTAPAGQLLAVRTLAKPCGVITAAGRISLQQAPADDLVLATGEPAYAEWCNGHGVKIESFIVTPENGAGPIRILGVADKDSAMIYEGGLVLLASPALLG